MMTKKYKVSILFVDDEDHILKAIARLMRNEPYILFFASSGREALEILKSEKIDIVVSDMRMPEMDGLTLIKQIKERYPDVTRIILSGYAQAPNVLAAINQGDVYKYITKPWNPPEEFKAVLKSAAEYTVNKKLFSMVMDRLQRIRPLLSGVEEEISSSGNTCHSTLEILNILKEIFSEVDIFTHQE